MLEQNPIGKGSALAQSLSFGALISTRLRLVSGVGEHPGEGDLGLVTEGLGPGCAGAPGAVLAQGCLQPWDLPCGIFSSQALSRAVWPGTALLVTPSMSPQLGKGPLDEERSGSGAGMQVWRGEAENAAS